MERRFHEELRIVTERLAAMGALVESRVRDAVAALVEQQPDLAVRVATGDDAVNDMELDVDNLCLKALALQHPVASDLRLIRSVIKANTDLERVGDQAVNLAHAVIDLIGQPPLAAQPDVIALGGVAIDMLHDSLTAFVEQDVVRARLVLERDDQADAMRDALFQRLLAQMRSDPETVHESQGLISITRRLERIADHATNIAEELIFLVEGRDVRHNRGHVA
jgi:phosphate transport system protein